jgi:hypothetical protein
VDVDFAPHQLRHAHASIHDRTLLVEWNVSLGEEKDTKTHRIPYR